jgi:excisionase family DNA binding protein
MTTDARDDHLSLGRVAKKFNVSRTTVWRWITAGQLTGYQLPGGHYRVRPEDLERFQRTFSLPDTLVKPTKTKRSKPDGRLLVQIADDHPDVVLLLRKVVERYLPGAGIIESINGVDTIITAGTRRPQLLLLDIMMPGMDGFAVLTALLMRPELADTRVAVVSAYEPFDRVEELTRLNPQIVASFRKPVSVDALGRRLQTIAVDLGFPTAVSPAP